MTIAQSLAKIHSESGVYSSKSLLDESGNIVNQLRRFSEFNYLTDFYDQYIQSYDLGVATQINDIRARSKDLFFIGENVIKTGCPKFFFLFEGSLSPTEKLSVTVLSHLWLTRNENLVKEFCGMDKWWTLSNYWNVKEKLKMNNEFASHSYVTDALRVGSNNGIKKNKEIFKSNQKLIYEEIILLKPKLVICVGKTAQDIVGMKYLNQDTKFHAIKFPKYHNEVDDYNELLNIMENI